MMETSIKLKIEENPFPTSCRETYLLKTYENIIIKSLRTKVNLVFSSKQSRSQKTHLLPFFDVGLSSHTDRKVCAVLNAGVAEATVNISMAIIMMLRIMTILPVVHGCQRGMQEPQAAKFFAS